MRAASRPRVPIALARSVESDPQFGRVAFSSGRPVRFTYLHNDEKSPKLGSRFGQDIEPSGFYVLHDEVGSASLPRKWTRGTATLRKPLVLRQTLDGNIYGPLGWKARLAAAFGAKKRALSRKLVARGFDGIVTVDGRGSTSEIVLLRA